MLVRLLNNSTGFVTHLCKVHLETARCVQQWDGKEGRVNLKLWTSRVITALSLVGQKTAHTPKV